MASLLDGISGEARATGKMTLEGVVENIPQALVSVGINAAGGAAAGRVVKWINEWKKGFGDLGVGLLAVAMKAGFPKHGDAASDVVRELAGGMAGAVGANLLGWLWNLVFSEEWRPMRSYKAGAKVKYKGEIWEATKEIPFPPQAEPSKDARWAQIRAQGVIYTMDDVHVLAQAFVSDTRRIDAFVDDVSADMVDRGQVNDREGFRQELKDSLHGVMQQFAAA